MDSGVDRLRAKIAQPYTQLESLLERHDRLCSATDLARRVQRVVLLSKRLQVQMSSLRQEERDEARRTALVDAAATCEDLDALVSWQEEDQDLSSISALEQHLAVVDEHKLELTQRMHDLLTSAFEQSVSSQTNNWQPALASAAVAQLTLLGVEPAGSVSLFASSVSSQAAGARRGRPHQRCPRCPGAAYPTCLRHGCPFTGHEQGCAASHLLRNQVLISMS